MPNTPLTETVSWPSSPCGAEHRIRARPEVEADTDSTSPSLPSVNAANGPGGLGLPLSSMKRTNASRSPVSPPEPEPDADGAVDGGATPASSRVSSAGLHRITGPTPEASSTSPAGVSAQDHGWRFGASVARSFLGPPAKSPPSDDPPSHST